MTRMDRLNILAAHDYGVESGVAFVILGVGVHGFTVRFLSNSRTLDEWPLFAAFWSGGFRKYKMEIKDSLLRRVGNASRNAD